jgi:argininosuccinate lyase
MTEELYATEEAYKLVRQGVPFRDAYRKVAERFARGKR